MSNSMREYGFTVEMTCGYSGATLTVQVVAEGTSVEDAAVAALRTVRQFVAPHVKLSTDPAQASEV